MPLFNFRKKKINIFFFLITGLFCGIILGSMFAVWHDLPQIRSLETFIPSSITRIYSADKVLLTELFVEKREPVKLTEMPCFLKEALIVTEDRKFYQHSGIDIKGILRAVIKDIVALKFVEGASTITQQLAKTLFLTNKKTIYRKISEVVLAFQLERRYTKDEILELYLNQVYFGSGAHGAASAARVFFDKSVNDLTLAESALIAGMPKAPSVYSPFANRGLAIKRKNIVLRQMLITGKIDQKSYETSVNEPLLFNSRSKNPVKAPFFVQYVVKAMEQKLGPSMLYRGGLVINTTLCFDLQKVAEKAMVSGLLTISQRMEKNDIDILDLEGALVSINVANGGILSMVGGWDFSKSPFNRAVTAKRQPGSAFKPILYAYALEQGFTQNSMILDAPVLFKGANKGKDWEPKNYSGNYEGEITFRRALAFSKNIPAVRLMEMLGPSPVAHFARTLGLESTIFPNLSLALGTSEVTLLNLTSAYAVFANGGNRVSPFGVAEVVGSDGRIIWKNKLEKQVVMSRANAAVTTDMLQGVIKEGTGKKARGIGRPLAGKTGTTTGYGDALFVGYSPDIATGVWIGRDRHGTLGNFETGAKAALPIWIEFMKYALEDKPFNYFDIPDSVVLVDIDSSTGGLKTNKSSDFFKGMFIKGSEPEE